MVGEGVCPGGVAVTAGARVAIGVIVAAPSEGGEGSAASRVQPPMIVAMRSAPANLDRYGGDLRIHTISPPSVGVETGHRPVM
jgi:hypothetical protein